MPTVPDNTGVERNLNWRPGLPDPRDHLIQDVLPLRLTARPDFVDLDPGFPNPLTDQGATGECTAHASLNDFEYILKVLGFQVDLYSHKAQYYLTRIEGGLPADQDVGAYNRDTVRVLTKIGAILASMHPDTTHFAQGPNASAVGDAAKRRVLEYVSVPVNTEAIKDTIAAGFPVIIGFRVTRDFMSTNSSGLISTDLTLIPNAGHAVVLVGYDDRPQSPTFGRFKIRNSWNTFWGDNGRAWMTYSWLMALGADFWAIVKVNGEGKVDPTPPPPPVPAATLLHVAAQPLDAVAGKPAGGFRVWTMNSTGSRQPYTGTVTGRLVSATRAYNNVITAPVQDGIAEMPSVTFGLLHPASEDMRWELSAPGLTGTRTRAITVTSGEPVPPPPPPPPPPDPDPEPEPTRHIVALKTEFTAPDAGVLTVYYSNGLGRTVNF